MIGWQVTSPLLRLEQTGDGRGNERPGLGNFAAVVRQVPQQAQMSFVGKDAWHVRRIFSPKSSPLFVSSSHAVLYIAAALQLALLPGNEI